MFSAMLVISLLFYTSNIAVIIMLLSTTQLKNTSRRNLTDFYLFRIRYATKPDKAGRASLFMTAVDIGATPFSTHDNDTQKREEGEYEREERDILVNDVKVISGSILQPSQFSVGHSLRVTGMYGINGMLRALSITVIPAGIGKHERICDYPIVRAGHAFGCGRVIERVRH
jgi:hypothetical protein